MKSKENVIITLIGNAQKVDLELPAFVKIKDIKPKIVGLLSAGNIDIPLNNIKFNNQYLDDELSLSQQGIWDGSILEVN